MGWGKYNEDNVEIYIDRVRMAKENTYIENKQTIVSIISPHYIKIAVDIKRRSESAELVDERLDCHDCGKMFDFTVSDQLYYKEKGYTRPKRCKRCREINRARRKIFG